MARPAGRRSCPAHPESRGHCGAGSRPPARRGPRQRDPGPLGPSQDRTNAPRGRPRPRGLTGGAAPTDAAHAPREPSGVTLVRGPTAIQLQAFRAAEGRSWGSVRQELAARIRRDGGTAEEFRGRGGHEIQARIPVVSPRGGEKPLNARIIGRDGPGRLLRGMITGVGADPGSVDEWSYETFDRTAVSITEAVGPGSSAVELWCPPREAG
ncbi:hypothetical protein DRB96_15455 [Streptomyces sp. ICC1]|nr:hypothetical protein DRB89_35410 [Streptomyces sp. ICC4]AWZ13478.1 hypothetical protein DRB96_15455 [Streptomyces sp. ICC1]